jgi:hypothetical protein
VLYPDTGTPHSRQRDVPHATRGSATLRLPERLHINDISPSPARSPKVAVHISYGIVSLAYVASHGTHDVSHNLEVLYEGGHMLSVCGRLSARRILYSVLTDAIAYGIAQRRSITLHRYTSKVYRLCRKGQTLTLLYLPTRHTHHVSWDGRCPEYPYTAELLATSSS